MSLKALSDALSQGLPAGIGFAIEDPRVSEEGLHSLELASVERAVPKRRREFAAGRRAARAAFARVGLPERPIPAGQDRAPVWPEGTIGSISHCDDACVAICAKNIFYQSLGIDVEAKTELAAELVDEICTSHELEALKAGTMPVLCAAKRLFSAKEAAFKAQFAVTGKMLGFRELSVKFVNNTEFIAYFVNPRSAFEKTFEAKGRSWTTDVHFMHIMIIA